MIRSTKLTTKFSNKTKLNDIKLFINEYKNVMKQCLDLTWNLDKIPSLAPKSITSQIKSWLSQRAIQCASKQTIAIVKGTKQKNKQRQYVIDKLIKSNFIKKAKALQNKLTKESKPNLDNVNPELDSRFVKIDQNNKTTFDVWITLTSLGDKLKIEIPTNKTKHFNSLNGKLKSGIRLSHNDVTFMFEEEIKPKNTGKTIGLDIGILTVATTSDNQVSNNDKHNWNLSKIIQRLNKKIKGSKAYSKVQKHRTNFVNWSINQLNFDDVKILRLENIKNVRKNKKTSKFLNHWTYTEIKRKLEQTCEKLGVQVEYVSATYTSQRCSSCGWVRRNNRKGKLFKCGQCNCALDSDLNGAKNIVANLRPIGQKERLLNKNRIGFYWN